MLNEKLAVIKFGGRASEDPDLRASFFENLRSLSADGFKFAIVHGGGPQINNLLKRLNIDGSFVNGLRVTDEATLEIVEMTLCGKVNKRLTRDLALCGLNAVGVSGEDGALLTAEPINAELGKVGAITKVNPALLRCLIENNYLPVVAPVALDANGEPLNVNADSAAAAVAAALQADYFILVSDVPGVMDQDGALFSYLSRKSIDELIEKGVINGGMIPKVKACVDSRAGGCKKTVVLDGRQKDNLREFLLEREAKGTEIDI